MPMTTKAWYSRAPGRAARPLALAVASALLLLAAVPRAGAADLVVQGAWMRLLMSSRPAAGYFVLRNEGATARTLVGASSPGCAGLMLHRSLDEGGQERMAMVASVDIPAHGTLRFAPGGYHLMCMSPGAAVRVGSSLAVTLRFADGATVESMFAVKGPTGQ